MAPTWLLDVDGVINAVSTYPKKSVWPDYTRTLVAGFPIWYSPTVVDFICRTHSEGRAHIAWLSTWMDQANEALAPALGLPQLPVCAHMSENSEHTGARWWKLQAAQGVPGLQPLVWTDDDISSERAAWQWASERPTALTIAPRTEVGLSPDDLIRIDKFLREQS